jgi:hypothetical protein
MLRSPGSGRSTSAARGARPTSSIPATGARRAVVVNVGRDLRAAARGQAQADGAHAGEAIWRRLADLAGDLLRELDVVAGQVDVERHERRASRHEHGPLARIEIVRSVVRHETAPRERLEAAAPDLRPLPPAGQLAVEEHRQPELVAHQRPCRERLRAGRSPARLVEVHDRRHVDGAHVRVVARVRREVDALDRRPRPVHERARELALPCRERENAAPVVGIGVRVEQPRRRKRRPDRGDGCAVAPLAHVGHGHQDRLSRLQRARLRSSAG